MKTIVVLLMGMFLFSCSTTDLSPGWRNSNFRCLKKTDCRKRLKRIVTAKFHNKCKFHRRSWEIQIGMTLKDNGYIDSTNVLNSTDENLTQCALKTLQSLEPYFEVTGIDAGKGITDKEIIFNFVSG